jgi:hypothetical protein
MDFLRKPPDWLTGAAPEGVRSFLENGGWYAVLGVAGLIILLILWLLVARLIRAVFGGGQDKDPTLVLDEDLEALPAPPPLTGDRRLTVEGVPVRLRLVVLAPAGRAHIINPMAVSQILDHALPGLAKIYADDRPQVRVWSLQLSYEGFANQFHNHMQVPGDEGDPSRWVLLAGRAQLDKNQIMLGLALQAGKPTTVGRLRLDKHEWTSTLRIRTRD